jgi:hypothetical protein
MVTIKFDRFNDSIGICGSYAYYASYSDGSPYDSSVFQFDFSLKQFSVYTKNINKGNIYNMKIRALLPHNYGGMAVSTFSINVICRVQSISVDDNEVYSYIYKL